MGMAANTSFVSFAEFDSSTIKVVGFPSRKARGFALDISTEYE